MFEITGLIAVENLLSLENYSKLRRVHQQEIIALRKLRSVALGGGYASEYPLYFARSLLTLLSDGQIKKAEQLLKASLSYIEPYETAAIRAILGK